MTKADQPCPECNGRGVIVDPWDERVDRCPSCTTEGALIDGDAS